MGKTKTKQQRKNNPCKIKQGREIKNFEFAQNIEIKPQKPKPKEKWVPRAERVVE